MSGETYTYVSMRRDRVEALQTQATRVDALEAERRLLEKQQRLREEQANRLQQQLRDNEARYEHHVRGLGQEMQALERDTKARFAAQRQAYQQSLEQTERRQREHTERRFKTMDEQVRRLDTRLSRDIAKVDDRVTTLTQRVQQAMVQQRSEYLDLFQSQEQQFQAALHQQGEVLQANIDSLARNLRERLQSEHAMAETWCENLRRELDFIRAGYRHEQFAPGELTRLEQRLQLAEGNIGQGIFQTAVATGQEAFLQARQLRERLELHEMQWAHCRQQAHESATAALLALDEHRVIEYSLEGQQSLSVEVDFWTQGQWTALRERVAAWQRQLEAPCSTLSSADLDSLRQQAEAAHDEALALVALARNAAFSSIQRRDIQAMVLERLTQLGFRHVDSSYAEEDVRRAYHLKLQNGNGDELVTIVAPTGDDFANQVTFDFFDRSPNEAVREERLNLIREQIEAEGEMEVAPMQCDPAYRDSNAPEERRDFTRVRRGQA